MSARTDRSAPRRHVGARPGGPLTAARWRRRPPDGGRWPPRTGRSAASRARIGGIAESATLAVDAKAKALKAAGRPVIGFGAGEPDFPTPDYIVEAAAAACRDPRNHRYTPAAGLPALREAVADKTLRDSGYEVDAAQVLITNGGKQAVYQAFATLLDPGDEVLLPAPYWTTYPEAIQLAGGVPVRGGDRRDHRLPGHASSSSRPRGPRGPRCCCSARRPTRPARSTRPSRSRRSAGGPREHGIWVITDEIYEHLVVRRTRAASSMPTWCPSSPTGASWSTASPRPTR